MKLKEKPLPLRRALSVLLVLFIAAVLAILSSDSIHGRWAHPKAILVSGNYVVVNDALRLNAFRAEDFQRDESGRMRYLAGSARTGVDVSAFQGDIDWAKVAADGVDFAFLRVGTRSFATGALRADKKFTQNAKNAAANGLDVGVYFFSQAVTPEEAVEEALYVLEALEGLNVTLPIVFDWEQVEEDLDAEQVSRTKDADGAAVTACAVAFLRTVEEAGRTGMLYCNGVTGYFFYDMAQLQDFPVWYASYSTGWPNYYYGVDLWQYSSTGRVQGIEGDVDLNLWPQTADGLLPFGESESGNAAMSESGNAAMSESGNAAMVSGAGAS